MVAKMVTPAGNNVGGEEERNHAPLDRLNVTSRDNEVDEYSSDDETKCGVFGIKPNWLQRLASKKTYVLSYGILGMNQSAMGSYFIGTISTIEKRFKIPSAKSGMIASAWDIGGLCSSIFMAYFGGSGHKTRWVALGSLVAAFSCFIRYLPHWIYGPGETTSDKSSTLCNATQTEEYCSLDGEGFNSFLILFFAHILLGIGTCTYYTLGVAYLDDNILKNKMPFLLALSTSLRGIGPPLGYLLSSYTLKIFVDPSQKPTYTDTDARWIGAWWYGWIPLGISHLFLGSVMALFPKTLPREAKRRKSSAAHWSHNKSHKSLKDFLNTMKRLLKNKILMFNSFSSTFYVFGMVAYWIFMPKYMETQFRITASVAAKITGLVSVVCLGLGVMTSGAVVSIFRPRPTYLAAWNVFTETVDTFGHLAFAFIGCPEIDMHGTLSESTGLWNTTSGCNIPCNCPDNIQYQPVCAESMKTTFFSPCHAGCMDSTSFFTDSTNSTRKTIYSNCSCVDNGLGSVTDGLCTVDCDQQFYLFLILFAIMKFLSSTGRAGNTVIQFRSVKPQDKSISIAFTEALLCILTFIPAPILYGYLQDYSCLIWNKVCDERGNCQLYDGIMMRYVLNSTASFFLLMATILDIGVLYNVRDLQIYDEETDTSKRKKSDHNDESSEEDEEEVEKSLVIHNAHPIG